MSDADIIDVACRPIAPRWLLIRVETADGTGGWGEAIVPKRRGAVVGAVADLARMVVGRPADRITEAYQRMRRGGFFRDGPILATAAAGIEQALWDIHGRRHGRPVYDLLGGPVRERVRLYAWIGGDRPADVVEHARRRVAQGFTAVKLNATAEADQLDTTAVVDEAVARVASLRAEFGPAFGIAVDFHGRVPRATAKVLAAELAAYRPMWIEEPALPGEPEALREIARAAAAVPIATGERLTCLAEFQRLLSDGVVDVLQPDVSLTGLAELATICRAADAYGVAVAPHCPNGPVSLAATLQVDWQASNVAIQEQSLGLHYNRGYAGLPPAELDAYLTDPAVLTPTDGHLVRGSGPGLGIELDLAAIDAAESDWWVPDPDWRHPDGRPAEW